VNYGNTDYINVDYLLFFEVYVYTEHIANTSTPKPFHCFPSVEDAGWKGLYWNFELRHSRAGVKIGICTFNSLYLYL